MTEIQSLQLRRPERKWIKHSTKESIPIELMDMEWLKNSINMIHRGHDIKGRRIGQEQIEKLPWLIEELSLREETEGWDS